MNLIYLCIPTLSLCTIKSNNPNDKRYRYCKNNNLIYVIAQIGNVYGSYLEGSAYSKGIKVIQHAMAEKGRPVSKSEIKRLVRPNYKKKHVIKFPWRIEEILFAIIKLVHGNKEVHKRCREMNIFRCEMGLQCYNFLIGELIGQLENISGSFKEGSQLVDVYNQLKNHKEKCS